MYNIQYNTEYKYGVTLFIDLSYVYIYKELNSVYLYNV